MGKFIGWELSFALETVVTRQSRGEVWVKGTNYGYLLQRFKPLYCTHSLGFCLKLRRSYKAYYINDNSNDPKTDIYKCGI